MSSKKWVICAPIDLSKHDACVLHVRGLLFALLKKGFFVTLVVPNKKNPTLFSHPNLEVVFYKNVFQWECLGVFSMIYTLWRQGVLSYTHTLYSRMHPFSFLLLIWVRMFYPQIRCISEHNGLLRHEVFQLLPKFLRALSFIGHFLQRWDGILSHIVRCVTPSIKESLDQCGSKNTIVIGNGTDIQTFKIYERHEVLELFSLPQDNFYIGFIGVITKWQALEDVLKAMYFLDQRIHFILAGTGAYVEDIIRKVEKSPFQDRIHMMGSIPIHKAPMVINCFDIALAPMVKALYEKSGSSKIKIRDYASCGRPIIAGNTIDHLIMEQEGTLKTYAMDDSSDLAKKIMELYHDQQRREYLSKNARYYAENHFSWDHLLQPLWEISL